MYEGLRTFLAGGQTITRAEGEDGHPLWAWWKIKSIKDVAEWKSTYSRVTGRQLAAEIYRVHIAYGVEFLFCDKRSTGRRIVELLEDTAWIEKR